MLLFSGYLKMLGRRQEEDVTILGTLAIPNQEVRTIYSRQFTEWFTRDLGGERERCDFLLALLRGDAEQVARQLAQWLLWHASLHDTAQAAQPERFYRRSAPKEKPAPKGRSAPKEKPAPKRKPTPWGPSVRAR